MFETGDYVVYGHAGICKVMGVTTMDMDGIPKERLYYILRPDGQTEGKIFTPVNSDRIALRRVMTKEEAQALIEEIPDIQSLNVENEKLREETYKHCIQSGQCRDLIRIIKTIYLRKKERLERGKKETAIDVRYLKLAEENLYSELSMLLGVPKNRMEQYIARNVREKQRCRIR